MKKAIFSLSAVLMMFAVSGVASASVVIYDFTGSGSTEPSIDFTVDGVTTTATATINGFGTSADVSRQSSGIGVKNQPLDDSDIDGAFNDDYLHLTFDFVVNLLGLDFGNDTSNDEYDLYVDGSKVLNSQETTGGFHMYTEGLYNGTSFTIRANDFNDDFTLRGMKVAVPEPASLALLGVGLLAFGLKRKRT